MPYFRKFNYLTKAFDPETRLLLSFPYGNETELSILYVLKLTDRTCEVSKIVQFSFSLGDLETIQRTGPHQFEQLSENVFDLKQFPKSKTPKTLVCHDMKGGYLGMNSSFEYQGLSWTVALLK